MPKKREKERIKSSFYYEGRRYYVSGYTQKELREKEYKKRLELEEGTQERENPTLNQYYDRFTENRRRKVKESTLRSDAIRFRNCANIAVNRNGKKLGEYRIKEIKPNDIQTVQNELIKSGRSTETVNNHIDHLRNVFKQAIRSEYIERNPCNAVENLRRTEKPARETIHRALSEDETKRFFEYAKDSYYKNAFLLMIKTGIRVGELAALSYTDADTKNGMLHISKTITRDEIGTYIIGDTPKTDAGNRDIPLNDDIIAIIRDQRALNRIVFGDRISTTLFRSPEGALLREYMVNREIKRICGRTGIEKFTCHSFRATFATRFIEQRPQDYKVLSEILGHSNIKITLNLYTHVMKESKVNAMQEVHIAI